MRPVLIAGNVVRAQLRSRNETELPQAEIELVQSRAAALQEPLSAAAVEWATTLVAATLPERQPYPRLYEALSGLLLAIESAPSAIGWAGGMVRFELLLLGETGYGRALPTLPQWIRSGGSVGWDQILAGLHLSGALLEREILTGRVAVLAAGRARLVDRLSRAAG